ncbi:MAG: 1-acyl-sn-glycerol-3-phosphate acyltransferase [Parachlamydiaceae bacterium]|nr:1-acyl-sn-glycerol-3-phosphate acyltransferase [Parachlamydiaceae bacterium]
MKLFYGLVRGIFKGYFQLFHRHRIYGLEHFIEGRGIIAPNHTSFLDPPIICLSWPEEIAFLARKSLFDKFILGSLISRLNAYPVSGTQQDLASIKLICQLLGKNQKVVIFPEGIRSADGEITVVKSGIGMLALRCQSPVIPTYIAGSYAIWNRHRRFPKIWGKTACVFGSPIYIMQFSHLDKKAAKEAIAMHVKEAIVALKVWYEHGAQGLPP